MATVFFRMSRSMRSRSFSRRSREISAAGSGTEGAAEAAIGCGADPACPPVLRCAPIAQHRGGDAQLAGDLHQRPTAARQQGDRLRLELIRKMTPFLAHSTPSRSLRSLAKVSTNSGEAQCPVGQVQAHEVEAQHPDPQRLMAAGQRRAGEVVEAPGARLATIPLPIGLSFGVPVPDHRVTPQPGQRRPPASGAGTSRRSTWRRPSDQRGRPGRMQPW